MKEYWFPDPSILLLRAKNTITPHARLPSCMINVKKTQIDFFVFNIRKHEIMKIGQDNENYMALIIWQCTHKSRITRGMIAYGMKLKHYWHSTFVLLCILFDNICIIKNILTSSRFMWFLWYNITPTTNCMPMENISISLKSNLFLW